MKTPKLLFTRGIPATLLVGTLALAACASTPPPTDALTAAESAIKHAEEARVADTTSPELTNARSKLAAARDAVTRDDMVTAANLARQAQLDADLATAKAEAMKSRGTVEELRKTNSALKQETLRNAADIPPVPVPPNPMQ